MPSTPVVFSSTGAFSPGCPINPSDSGSLGGQRGSGVPKTSDFRPSETPTNRRLSREAEIERLVNAIETGRYDPSLPLAFKIASIFELPMEQLFFPEE